MSDKALQYMNSGKNVSRAKLRILKYSLFRRRRPTQRCCVESCRATIRHRKSTWRACLTQRDPGAGGTSLLYSVDD